MKKKKKSKIPNSFKPYFWSHDASKLELKKDAHLIIHQILAYGDLDDIKKLIKYYGLKKVRREFLKPGHGMYPKNILDFIKLLLGIKKLNKRKYIKDIIYGTPSRSIR